jgi:hypothetical protein
VEVSCDRVAIMRSNCQNLKNDTSKLKILVGFEIGEIQKWQADMVGS